MTGREVREEQTDPRSRAPEDVGRVPRPKTGPEILILFGILFLGVAVQLAIDRSHRIHWNSDQAIVGLMARHILHGTAYPVFYYGSAYAGTLESYYMAAVFSVAGSSIASYRASLMILLALLSLIVYAIGRRVFGAAAALFAVAYLAIPPYLFLYKGLTSDGAYVSLALVGAALLYGAVRLDEAETSGRNSLRWIALIGLLAGLGWWVLTLSAYFYIAILLWFAIVRPRVFIGVARYFVFLAAFLLGSAPWWWANVGKGWPSLHTPALARGSAGAFGRGVLEFFSPGVPCLLGARLVEKYHDVVPAPAATAIALLLFDGTVIAAVTVGVRYRWGRNGNEDSGPRRARVILLLLLSIVSMQILVAFNPDTYAGDPRYLYPFYAPFALLFGFAVTLVGRTRLAWARIPILASVLMLNGVSLVRARRVDLLADIQPTPAPLTGLIRVLGEVGTADVYTDYWTAYGLAFESEERIRAASFGDSGFDRYPPYARAVALSVNPAFVLWGEEAERFRRYLRVRGCDVKEARVGIYQIFWDVAPEVVRAMAKLRHIPSEEQ